MGIKVAKFGGTSLADATQFRKVIDIVHSDPDRRYIVPSAPGKRYGSDIKVTDMLLGLYETEQQGGDITQSMYIIQTRYNEIIRDLGISLDLTPEFQRITADLAMGASRDYCASRGEYLSGKIIAAVLNFDFVDPGECIFFDASGHYDIEKTHQVLSARLQGHEYAVIPGFYGQDANGNIKTFSRGGSDITGAIVARTVSADVYENWTDVNGFMMTDPKIVPHARTIEVISYRELRELSYMGANVLHEESIFPVKQLGIPINVRNTNMPEMPGTMIVDKVPESRTLVVTGIAGKKNFTVIQIEKERMNTELGFGRKVLDVLENAKVSFEHMPTGIDTLSVVISDQQLNGKLDELLTGIRAAVQPNWIEVESNMALIATVGQGMVRRKGIAATLFNGLAHSGVNVRMIDQGSSEMNIIVGVENEDFEKAVHAIYESFNT